MEYQWLDLEFAWPVWQDFLEFELVLVEEVLDGMVMKGVVSPWLPSVIWVVWI